MSELQVRPLSEIEQSLNWLIYADPGNCKTTMAATMAMVPEMSPVLHVNIDGGLLTIRDMDLDEDSIHVVDINHSDQFEELYHKLRKDEEYSKFRSVCVDNGTELYAMALEETIKGNVNKTSRSGKKRTSLDDAWIDDRSAAGAKIGRLFRWFRDLPQHIVFTAHVRREFPKKENMPDATKPPLAVEPDFPPALSRRMRGYVDFVWYLKRVSDGDSVSVITQPTGPYWAKTRGVRLRKQFAQGFHWPIDFGLMPALYDTIINKAEFPLDVVKPKPAKPKDGDGEENE